MIDSVAHLRGLWDSCEVATSRRAALGRFVKEVVCLVQQCKRIHVSCDLSSITFALGGSDGTKLGLPIARAKGQLRSMIPKLVDIAAENGVAGLNPYGDSAIVSLQDDDNNTFKINITFDNTMRQPYFSIQLIE